MPRSSLPHTARLSGSQLAACRATPLPRAEGAVRRRKRSSAGATLGMVMLLAAFLLLGSLVFRLASQQAAASVFSGPPPVAATALPGGVDDCQLLPVPQEQLHTGALVLVNAQAPATLPGEDALLTVYGNKNRSYKVKDCSVQVAALTMEPLNGLMEGFAQATGLGDINVISGFRTVEEQQAILEERIERLGQEEAARWVAAPGCSEHHTGLAVDLSIYHETGVTENFQGQGQYGWVEANCASYGFILRYSEEKTGQTGIAPEPWHFRYVGAPHAAYMMGEGLCLEEYLALLRQYRYDTQRLQITDPQGGRWEVWYVPATGEETQVPVPTDKPYTLSGDNVGGFIVTVQL